MEYSLIDRLTSRINRRILRNTDFAVSIHSRLEILRRSYPKKLKSNRNKNLYRILEFSPTNLIILYSLKVTGIIHVGAHIGQEAKSYRDLGVEEAIFVEPLLENFTQLKETISRFEGYQAINAAAGDRDGKTIIHKASNGLQSSSVLIPRDHLQQNPDIKFEGIEEVKMIRLESIPISDIFNFWVIDVQGFELEVLKGAGDALNVCQYLFIEVNRSNVYEGCVQVKDLDGFLATKGFTRTLTRWWDIWGDALYVRTNLLPLISA